MYARGFSRRDFMKVAGAAAGAAFLRIVGASDRDPRSAKRQVDRAAQDRATVPERVSLGHGHFGYQIEGAWKEDGKVSRSGTGSRTRPERSITTTPATWPWITTTVPGRRAADKGTWGKGLPILDLLAAHFPGRRWCS